MVILQIFEGINGWRGVLQDYMNAVKWYTLAAEQGYAQAQLNLGVMYYLGEGILQDYIYAHVWSNIAASTGFENAAKNRDIIVKQMTPTQLEKAQDLARACAAKDWRRC